MHCIDPFTDFTRNFFYLVPVIKNHSPAFYPAFIDIFDFFSYVLICHSNRVVMKLHSYYHILYFWLNINIGAFPFLYLTNNIY